MQKWVCSVCGYVYDPEVGDPENGSRRAQLLKTFPRIGCVPNAAREKICLKKLNCSKARFMGLIVYQIIGRCVK